MIDLAQIKQKIQQTFSPLFLEIDDESQAHAGHSGAVIGEITHLRITICSEYFNELSKIKQHRSINECLKDELNSGLHALALKTYNTQQWEKVNHG
ncbi:BolA family transcriptional regulator [Lentisphaera marina]|uniref:BolA family protein n=1 Tax=Lentisphaera marina TaxID=1111041 RepID=UPI0023659FD2|nr:BolA family protein [Lentisphaera marina]MDD7985821.1 BolA family transcriptional regulator [Lentisphaera marina]